ncbi:SCO2322 family protein [Streptomyces sp. NPDC058001]|uniref:SCO2322 family protein n=1 Tax=Streptomyces sp. NPDC058001 TaxID=3346300 RepID=UPI0036E595B8
MKPAAVLRRPGPAVAALFGALLVALCVTLLGAAPAHAAGYRYWSFWDLDGDRWAYATQGPSTARPSDGDVQGFRFAVSEDSQDATTPRGAHDFGAICDGTPARSGEKRIALVVDFGTAGDAPDGETPPAARTACARVGEDATTAEALAEVAKPLRYDTNALLCAISGYPKAGCGEQVAGSGGAKTGKATTASDNENSGDSGDSGGSSVGVAVGIGAVVVLGGAAYWQSRRRRG